MQREELLYMKMSLNRLFQLLACFLSLLFFSSCSYHMLGMDKNEKVSLAVPFAEGDFNGLFTDAVVSSINSSTELNFDPDADLVLKVAFLEEFSEKIGYKYDRETDGKLKKNLLPTENRQIVKLNVSIFSKAEEKVIFGPFQMSSDVDFDYVKEDSLEDLSFINQKNKRQTVLSYSLGQLESITAAEAAAKKALYKKTAKKLIETLDSKLVLFFKTR